MLSGSKSDNCHLASDILIYDTLGWDKKIRNSLEWKNVILYTSVKTKQLKVKSLQIDKIHLQIDQFLLLRCIRTPLFHILNLIFFLRNEKTYLFWKATKQDISLNQLQNTRKKQYEIL